MWQKRTMYGVLCALLALVLAGCGGSSSGGGSSPKGPVTLAGYCDASQKFAMGNEICLRADSKHGEGYVLSTAFQWTLLEKPEGSDVSIPGGWGPGTLTFTPDKTGVYRVRVVGDAGNRLSDPVDLEMEVLPWSGGVPISTPDAIRVTHFELAGDGNGNAIAIWQQLEQDENFDEVLRLYTADFNANNGWDPAHLLSEDTGNDGPHGPQAVLHQDGRAAAMWFCYEGYELQLCAAARDSGSWSSAEVIGTFDEYPHLSSAKLLLTPTGERLVFLPTQDGQYGSGTLFQFSEGTHSWEEVGTPSPSPFYSAVMQVEGEDRLVRVDRKASYYDPDTQAWVEFGDPRGDDATPWSRLIEGDGAGNAMYVWVQREYEEDESSPYQHRDHFYSSYYDGEEWSVPTLIAEDTRWTGRSFLTFEGDGEVVFWRFIEEDPRKLWRSHYSDGEWSEAVEEEAPLTPLHIVSRSDENWMVIGSSGSQAEPWQIASWHHSSASGWESEVRPIESENPGGVIGGAFRASHDQEGNTVLIWRQRHDLEVSSGLPSGLYSARYDAQSDRWIRAEP